MGMRNRKVLCIITAVVMFLSGICLESARANALFVYPSVQAIDGNIISVNAPGMEEQLCTSEMLGVRMNVGLCQKINRMNAQRGLGSVLYVLNSEMYSAGKESRFINSLVFPFYYPCQDIFVINYIHQSDGKKRNESLTISCL